MLKPLTRSIFKYILRKYFHSYLYFLIFSKVFLFVFVFALKKEQIYISDLFLGEAHIDRVYDRLDVAHARLYLVQRVEQLDGSDWTLVGRGVHIDAQQSIEHFLDHCRRKFDQLRQR